MTKQEMLKEIYRIIKTHPEGDTGYSTIRIGDIIDHLFTFMDDREVFLRIQGIIDEKYNTSHATEISNRPIEAIHYTYSIITK